MKNLLLLLFLLSIGWGFGQQTPEFSFDLYFEDAAGNKDTITLGYDSNATDTINVQFNEVNILGQSIDTNLLDVRLSNNIIEGVNYSNPDWFQTKRKIVPYNCMDNMSSVWAIEIHTKSWPVTVECDSSSFHYYTDSCRKESIMTSIDPGGWFDVGSESDLGIFYFYENAAKTFTPNFDSSNNYESGGNYFDVNGNRISRFWMVFAKDLGYMHDTLGVSKQLYEKIKVYPNPFTNEITIENLPKKAIVKVYNLQGEEIEIKREEQSIYIQDYPKGLYILSITNNLTSY